MYKRNANFVSCEEEVLKYWRENKCFEKSCNMSDGRKRFVFYDGPPFATGLPHYGHILSGSIKDTIARFYYQQGYRVDRRFGWDCHGLPVEYEIDKSLGITSRDEVVKMGIDKYNKECRAIVMKYSGEWKVVVERMGRWVSFEDGYRTMDLSFMESVWNIFKELFRKNLIYRGYKVMPFSTTCSTPLSNFEANQNYKEVSDPSALVVFPLIEPFLGYELSLVAWTTTPWTLPSNCALVVNPSFSYGIFEHKGKFYAMNEKRIREYFKDAKVLKRVSGSDLDGLEYEQPFRYFESYREQGFFRVITSGFVTDTDGTGIVHCAPGFGEEDYNVFVDKGLIRKNDLVPCPVDENGRYTDEVKDYAGRYVKDCDKAILEDIRSKVLMNGRIVHSYPFCWRSDTPLLYKLVANWFVNVKDHVACLLRNNEKINWVPENIKYRKFHNWLENARDWSISRNRFWGTPIPLWVTEDYSDVICVGSVSELEKLSGRKIVDIHREFIDDIVIVKDGREYRRVEEVLDCWFESGSMPYAQDHWPFNRSKFDMKDISDHIEGGCSGKLTKDNFPADFIGEGLDQTRGWFYTLHVISSLLFDQPAFLNVIVNGIVQAEDGRKMSKRLKNYPDPTHIFRNYGADSLRMYLISSPVVKAENLKFSERGVKEILKTLIIPWYNSLGFCLEAMESPSNGESLPMDGWIEASFSTFVASIVADMRKYELSRVLNLALRFVDDLSNWYIRIHRKEIRMGRHSLLSRILKEFSIVMGPFTPFFSEYSYQSLNPGDSVHFQMYPVYEARSHPFAVVKEIITSVRCLREVNSISLKTPLKSVAILADGGFHGKIEGYESVIKNECNVLELICKDEDPSLMRYSAKPNFGELRKNKSVMKKKIDAIEKLSEEQVRMLMTSPVEVDGVRIRPEDVLATRRIVCDSGISQAFGGFSIIIDNTLDENIIELKVAREFHSYIQKLRKSVGLNINDDVLVQVDCQELRSVASKHFRVAFGDVGILCGKGSYELDGTKYDISLYKRTTHH